MAYKGFNLTQMIDTDYLDQLKEGLVAKMVAEGVTTEIVDVIPGVKNAMSLNLVNNNITVSDAGCGFTPAGDVQLIQKELRVVSKAVQDTLCPQDLEKTYLGTYMKNNKEIPFIEIIANTYVNRIKRWNDEFIWDGDGVYDGFVKTLSSDANVIKAATEVAAASGAVAKMNALIAKATPELKTKENKVIFTSFKFYDEYMAALRAANLYNLANTEYRNGSYQTTLPGTDIKLVATVALDNLVNNTIATGEPLIYTHADNLVVGTDLLNEEELFDIWYSRDNNEVRVNISWKIGTQFRFADTVVIGYTLA